jgi:sporulation protein YlmC with PRC-barrel domain
MKQIRDITVDPQRGRVTMRFVERNYQGFVMARSQVTVDRAEFERAVREAGMIVPWDEVKS